MKHCYDEYMADTAKLFDLMFGKDIRKKLEKTKVEPFDWDGIEIEATSILVGFPNMKKRFNHNGIEYFLKEGRMNAFEMFCQAVFHFGYNQCDDHEVKPMMMRDRHENMKRLMERLKIKEEEE